MQRIHAGDKLVISTVSSIATKMRAIATVLYDNGTVGLLSVLDFTVASTRTAELWFSTNGADFDGDVTQLSVYLPDDLTAAIVSRGQLLVKARVGDSVQSPVIAQGYVYDFGALTLGQHDDAGPRGGSGWLRFRVLKSNTSPPASSAIALATTFTVQVYHAIGWWYHCSAAVANRLLDLDLRTYGIGVLPTGFAAGAVRAQWRNSGTLTLSAGEDGMFYIDETRAMRSDNGTITVDNTSTAPSPLPITVVSDDLATLSTGVTLPDATDVETIVALVEEWITF